MQPVFGETVIALRALVVIILTLGAATEIAQIQKGSSVFIKVPADLDVPFYGHWKAAAHFVRVLRGDEELMIEKDQVLNVIGALDALYRSAEAGSEVRL